MSNSFKFPDRRGRRVPEIPAGGAVLSNKMNTRSRPQQPHCSRAPVAQELEGPETRWRGPAELGKARRAWAGAGVGRKEDRLRLWYLLGAGGGRACAGKRRQRYQRG